MICLGWTLNQWGFLLNLWILFSLINLQGLFFPGLDNIPLHMPYFNLQKLSSSLKRSSDAPALGIRVLAHTQPCLDIKSSQDSWLELEHILVISCSRSISHLQEVCICQQQTLSSPSVTAEPETRTSSPCRSVMAKECSTLAVQDQQRKSVIVSTNS